MCICVCSWAHSKLCRGYKRTQSVPLCPPYPLKMGFLTDGAVRLAASKLQGSSCFSPHSTGVTSLENQTRIFVWGSKLWSSCRCSNSCYPLIHMPNPRIQNFNLTNYKSILKSSFYILYVLPLPTPTESILFSLWQVHFYILKIDNGVIWASHNKHHPQIANWSLFFMWNSLTIFEMHI